MRAPPFCLIGPHFFANLEFLIYKIHELEHLSWNVNPTSQLSKVIGTFRNLAPKLSLRIAGVLSMYSLISLPNPPYSQLLSL
jgi:hypothetical protein